MFTTYFLNRIAGSAFKSKTTYAMPENLYLGLSTTAPAMDGSGVKEPSGGGYKRIALNSLMGTPSEGVVANSAQVAFDESTASWGTVRYFVVFDAVSGGNLLVYQALDEARAVEKRTLVLFKAGELSFSITNEG